jgi:hypothetical protein
VVDGDRADGQPVRLDDGPLRRSHPLDVLNTPVWIVELLAVGDVRLVEIVHRVEQIVDPLRTVETESFPPERPASEDEVEEAGVVIEVVVVGKTATRFWLDESRA